MNTAIILAAIIALTSLALMYVVHYSKNNQAGKPRKSKEIEIIEQKPLDHRTRFLLVRCSDQLCFLVISEGRCTLLHKFATTDSSNNNTQPSYPQQQHHNHYLQQQQHPQSPPPPQSFQQPYNLPPPINQHHAVDPSADDHSRRGRVFPKIFEE